MILNNVIVTKESLEHDDPYEIIMSNIDTVNFLFNEHVRQDEVCIDALKSYYVDYYLAQVNNGGFSQFVYNSNWDQSMVSLILDGLQDMGATMNLKLFKKLAKIVSSMSPKNFERYLEGDYFGNFLQIDHLNKFDNRFFKLEETEDLIEVNSRWLKGLMNLSILTETELKKELKILVDSIPNKSEREHAALEEEYRYMKIIRALCKEANQDLDFLTTADSVTKDGVQTYAYHFVTNEGHHHMVEVNKKGTMYKGNTDEVVVEIKAGE